MGTVYVATSKALQEWGADVGLGKNLYKLGYVEDGTPAEALDGFAGQTDWKVLKADTLDGTDEETLLAKLGRKEKAVDPTYYPKLRGAQGIFKVNPTAVENSKLVALALEGKETKAFKLKPADIADYLVRNAV